VLPRPLAAHPLRGLREAQRRDVERTDRQDLTDRLAEAACDTVYATTGYEQSAGTLAQVSLERDNVFSDDAAVHQLATMSGGASIGYTAALTIGV
jgi:hypothetical protein